MVGEIMEWWCLKLLDVGMCYKIEWGKGGSIENIERNDLKI